MKVKRKTLLERNSHVHPLFANLFQDFANIFSKLDAQSPESSLAKVSMEEQAPVAFNVPVQRLAHISPEDMGDDDRRLIVYNVWSDNEIVADGFNSPKVAREWAERSGYKVTN